MCDGRVRTPLNQEASKPIGGIPPVAVKPSRSTAPSVPVHFPLGWTTWLFFFLLVSYRVCVSSSHQMLLPALIPSQELKPPSEAAKRPPGAPGGRRAEVSTCTSDSASITERPPRDPLHCLASRDIQGHQRSSQVFKHKCLALCLQLPNKKNCARRDMGKI